MMWITHLIVSLSKRLYPKLYLYPKSLSSYLSTFLKKLFIFAQELEHHLYYVLNFHMYLVLYLGILLYPIAPVCLHLHVPVLYCFNYRSLLQCFSIWKDYSLFITLLFQCFPSYSCMFISSYELSLQLIQLHEKKLVGIFVIALNL